jgi:predicted Fe-Mo cluster-binding NifX family protein
MYTVEETITPERAHEYLKRNTNNYRRVRMSDVNQYSCDMKAGRWEFNGESIKFSKSGVLLDGQHRLMAIEKAGIPIKTMVTRDVDDYVTIYDSGSTRTPSQILAANGVDACIRTNTNIAAATIFINKGFKIYKQSKARIVYYMSKNNEGWICIDNIIRTGGHTSAIAKKAAIACGIYCLLREGASVDYLKRFFSVVNTGFPDAVFESSPAIVLRNMLIAGKGMIKGGEYGETLFCATVRGFYDFMSGMRRTKKYTIDEKSMKLFRKICKEEFED